MQLVLPTLQLKLPGIRLSERIVVMLSCILLSACTDSSQIPLRIGINPWPGYEFLYLAKEKGFFQEAGIAVQIVELSTLADTRRAFEQGLVDGIGCTLMEAVLAAHNSEREPKIVSIVDYSAGSDAIIAREAISSFELLRGKRIGVEVGSIGMYLLYRALENHHMTLSDVTILPMSPLQQEISFQDGSIDAAVIYPPILSRLQRIQKFHILFSSNDIPNEIVDILMFDGNTIKNRRKQLTTLLQVLERSVAYAVNEPEEAFAIMAAKEHITPQEMHRSMDGIKLLTLKEQREILHNSGQLEDAIVRMIKVLTIIKQIQNDKTVDPRFLVDSSVINVE